MTQIALASNNPFKKLVESPALAAPPEFRPPPPLKSALKNTSSLPDLRPPLPLKRSPESISYLPDIRPTTPLKSALKSTSTAEDLRSATSLIDFEFPKSVTLPLPLRPKTPQEKSRNSAPPLPTQRPATARGPSRNSAPVAPLQSHPVSQKNSHYSTSAQPAQYPTTPRHTRNSAPIAPLQSHPVLQKSSHHSTPAPPAQHPTTPRNTRNSAPVPPVQPPTPSRKSYHSVPVPPHQLPSPPRKNSYSSVPAPPLQRPTTPRRDTSARPSTAPPEVRPTTPFKNVSNSISVLTTSRPTSPLTGVLKGVPPPPSDIHLVLNNTSIFDPSLPEIALYELSHPISVNSPVKIKSLIFDGKGDSPKYKELYSFKCDRRGFAHVIEIQEPHKTSSLGRHKTSNLIDLRATTSIEDHRVWEVILRQPDSAIKIIQGFKFATTSAPVMWRDGMGNLLAIDSVEYPEDRKLKPMLRIVQDRDERTMDLLVVAWCARLWGSEHEIRWERELELERDKEILKIGAGGDEKVPRRSILGIKW